MSQLQTIITTAVPTIAAHFNASQAEYTWIGSAYMLAAASSTPAWGKFSDIWGRKPILLLANLIFFVGSLIAAVSVSVNMLLIGRAIQGIGGGGLLILANICISDLFSMRWVSVFNSTIDRLLGEVLIELLQGTWQVFWNDWWSMGSCQRHRSSARRRLHRKGLVALVFLHQL